MSDRSLSDLLSAAGVKRPVALLWFSKPRAFFGLVFFGACVAMGLWIARSFHLHPDEVISARHAWMSTGHGMIGFLFGLGFAVLCARYVVICWWRLAAAQSAFAITASGVRVNRSLSRRTAFAWDAIECVKVERSYVSSRIPFAKPAMYAELVLYPAQRGMDRRAKPVKIRANQIEGGLIRTCRFADTLDRLLARTR